MTLYVAIDMTHEVLVAISDKQDMALSAMETYKKDNPCDFRILETDNALFSNVALCCFSEDYTFICTRETVVSELKSMGYTCDDSVIDDITSRAVCDISKYGLDESEAVSLAIDACGSLLSAED